MADSALLKLSQRWRSFIRTGSERWLWTGLGAGLLGAAILNVLIARRTRRGSRPTDAASTDPGLLKKGTTFERYETASGFIYPRIRTFYSAHPQAHKLPEDLPLLVFVHGLGGSVAQFAPLLTSIVNIAPCLAIDLPGCGLSDLQPSKIEAYTTTAFAELVFAAIDRYRNKSANQKVVLIGHSMGCSISALLASSSSPLAHLCLNDIVGMVAICPRASALSEHDLASIRKLNRIPSLLFDFMRLFDRRGGVDSVSVRRVVGKDADLETKKLQLRFNQHSRSATFQRFCLGMHLLETSTSKKGEESLLGERVWRGIKLPMFLVAAEDDKLASPKEVEKIGEWLSSGQNKSAQQSTNPEKQQDDEIAPDAPAADATTTEAPPATAGDAQIAREQLTPFKPILFAPTETNSTPNTTTVEQVANSSTGQTFAVKTTVFPAPASHGLLYTSALVRILSGLIENFGAKYIDPRLSPGWQLQHLTTTGKWDVKNLAKWQRIDACSEPIAGIFRAMKTMREVDDEHCPTKFVQKFGFPKSGLSDGVAMVVDISHESPVYDKNGLEAAGVQYHKFPTVSKLPPSPEEVEHFIALVDGLRQALKARLESSAATASDVESVTDSHPTIGVHCHYGFNRTGFFIVCYLVERAGYTLQDALGEFAQKRAPGIKHDYFVNELYVRYANPTLRRRGTVVG